MYLSLPFLLLLLLPLLPHLPLFLRSDAKLPDSATLGICERFFLLERVRTALSRFRRVLARQTALFLTGKISASPSGHDLRSSIETHWMLDGIGGSVEVVDPAPIPGGGYYRVRLVP